MKRATVSTVKLLRTQTTFNAPNSIVSKLAVGPTQTVTDSANQRRVGSLVQSISCIGAGSLHEIRSTQPARPVEKVNRFQRQQQTAHEAVVQFGS